MYFKSMISSIFRAPCDTDY